jgi:hypothetical protein
MKSLVTAENQVWDAYLEVHHVVNESLHLDKPIPSLVVQKQPKHAKWRTQPFRHYDECAVINEHTMATGENTFSSGIMGGSQGHSPAQIDIDDAVFGAVQPVI